MNPMFTFVISRSYSTPSPQLRIPRPSHHNLPLTSAAPCAILCMAGLYGMPTWEAVERNIPCFARMCWDSYPTYRQPGLYIYRRKECEVRKRVELSFILDETGSMEVIRADTIGSFNTFLEEQRGLDADVTFSLTYFSLVLGESTYRPRYKSAPLPHVQPLTEDSYRPRGNTPLLDAIGGTIDELGARLADMYEEDRPDQVIVVVLTDGEENSSSEYTIDQVKEKIAHQRDVYKWEFIFLGCGIDAYDVAGQMSFAAAYTSSHDRTSKGVYAATMTASTQVRSLVEDGGNDTSAGWL